MSPQHPNATEHFDVDVDMPDVEDERQRYEAFTHFKIAIDFGTTCSSVAVVGLVDPGLQRRTEPEDIPVIARYPNAPEGNANPRYDVPTECWYPNVEPTIEEISAKTHQRFNSMRMSSSSPTVSADDSTDDEETMADMADMEADRKLRYASDYYWGYGVTAHLDQIGIGIDRGNRLTRFKLMLDNQDSTLCVRQNLAPILARLKDQKRIKEDWHIIAHFLENLFRHVYQELTETYGFNADSSVEHILCVPAAWTPKACRVMQTAMTEAIGNSGITRLWNKSIDNLFIVSEPEAATLCVMENSRDIKVPHSATDELSC